MGLGRPKQYLPVAGRALVEWSLAPFLRADWVDGVVVVLARGDSEFARLPIARHPKILITVGGAARLDSVLAGLTAVAEPASVTEAPVYVLVHDAARPCVTVDDIERLCREASDEHGGLLALPLTEAVKREVRERAEATLNSGALWRAQSPQLFRLDLLHKALEAARTGGATGVDEAAAMEAAGMRPRLVRGRESNLKVTYPEDVPLAEFWLSRAAYLR
ncbi:MAG: 2-C-methyl-D-erythritol 4-phosphate cytidylyltransferase [Gammaproteobacteria bacterium]|nr:2-C-methyl-D-erythritol 4-phosphate cytidylyltransferase [Gammaproteobacteria bacterium]